MMSGEQAIVKPSLTPHVPPPPPPSTSQSLISTPAITINSTHSRISTRTTRLTGALRRGFISALALSPQGKNSAVGDLVGNLAPERYKSLPPRTRAAAKALIIVALSRSLNDTRSLTLKTPTLEGENDGNSAWFDAVAAALDPDFDFPISPLDHLQLSDNKNESNPRIFQLPLEPVPLDCVYGVDCVNSVLAKPSNETKLIHNQKDTWRPTLDLIFQQPQGNPTLKLGFAYEQRVQENDVNVMDVDEMEPIFVRNVKHSSFINNEDTMLSTHSPQQEPNFLFRKPLVTPLDLLMQELHGKSTPRAQKKNPPTDNPDIIILDSTSKQKAPSSSTKPSEPTSATLRERKRLRKRRSRTSEVDAEKAEADQRELTAQKERMRNNVISTMQEDPKVKRASTNIADPRRISSGKSIGLRERPARRAAAPSKIIESDSDSARDNDQNDNDPDVEAELGIVDVPLRNQVRKKVSNKPSNSTPTSTRTRNTTNVSNGGSSTQNQNTPAIATPIANERNEATGKTKTKATVGKTKATIPPAKSGNHGHGTGKAGSQSAAKNAARSVARTTRSKAKTKDVNNEAVENKLVKSISLDDIDAAADAAAEDRSEPEIMEEEEIIEEHEYVADKSETIIPVTPVKSNEKVHVKKAMEVEELEPWRRGLYEVEKKLECGDNDSLSLSSSDSEDSRPIAQVLPNLMKLLAYAKKEKLNLLELDKFDEEEYMREYYGSIEDSTKYDERGPSPGTQFAIDVYERHRNGGQQSGQMMGAPITEEIDGIMNNNLTAQAIDEVTHDLNLPVISLSHDSSDATSNDGSSCEEHDGASGDDARTEKGSSRKKPTKPADLRMRVCAGLLDEMTVHAKRKVLRWARRDHSWFDENQDFAEVVAKRDTIPCNRCQALDGKQAQCEETILFKLWRDMSWRRVRRMRHKRPGGRGRSTRG